MPTPFVTVNRRRYSHASLTARVFGERTKGIKEISYKHSMERAGAEGASRQMGGMTVGMYKPECTATFYRAEWEAIKGRLNKISGGQGQFDVSGEIVLSMAERGQPTITDTIVVYGVKESELGSSGGDPNTVKVAFDVAVILENGVDPFEGVER